MYDNATKHVAGIGTNVAPSLTERLKGEQENLKRRLDDVTAVIKSLEANPETQAILDSVARLGHLNY